MTISFTHPHAARMTELKLLGAFVFLGLCLIGIIMFLGTGGQVRSGIPGVSAWEVFLWNLPKIAPIAIPLAVTVVVWLGSLITNSYLFERRFNVTGCTSGETAFMVIGTWFGFGVAMVAYPKWGMYSVQEVTCFCVGLMTAGFAGVAILSRGVR